MKFIFIVPNLPRTQEEEYKVYSIFPHSWNRCLTPSRTISAHCLWFRFIASLILLHTQRNPQHFLIVKQLAIHTGIRLREPLANICLNHICKSLLRVGFQKFIILIIAHNFLCYFNILAIYIASLTTIYNYKEQHLEIHKQSILCYSLVIIRCWIWHILKKQLMLKLLYGNSPCINCSIWTICIKNMHPCHLLWNTLINLNGENVNTTTKTTIFL